MDTLTTITTAATTDGKEAQAQAYYTQYLQALQTELTTDPTGQDYAGKTAQQVADRLNTAYTLQEASTDEDGNPTTIAASQTPRIALLVLGVPYAPNVVLAADVTAAQTL